MDPKKIINYVSKHTKYIRTQEKTLDILEGCLTQYIEANLAQILSPRVFAYAQKRMVPINIFPRYVDKLTGIYQHGVLREVQNGDDSDESLLSWYQEKLDINNSMQHANRLFNACKNSLLSPFCDDNGPSLRVIPNDRFLVWSDDPVNPLKATGVILFFGKDAQNRDIYHVYTDNEFLIIRSDESIDYEGMDKIGIPDGINQFGVLPFIYSNSSALRLIPVPDYDSIKMTEYVPEALTDLNMAAMFSSFSMTYIKNGSVENPIYAPNALWFLKSDDPEKDPEIGTIKPEVDYQEVLNLIQSELSMWLASKGIKAGSVGSLTVETASSGIAKIIDEADTYDVIQKQMVIFQKTEQNLWDLILKSMHPVWVAQRKIQNTSIFSPGASVSVKYSVVPVGTQRKQIIEDQRAEYAAGFTTRKRAISELNPQLSIKEVDELIHEIDEERGVISPQEDLQASEQSQTIETEVSNGNQMAEDKD